ncbi:hypothetical protein LMG27174_06735 [Paraburkholderia rhynchosiae]|uniref:Uncharacterized protein n=1 Tax=Paraburkholderia rhynchosiae TaxID=487049 RepID=A0A6J5CNX4_9BURK|nr:hypothetical protein LMG27174_06735 [Paraburkholderia rhynchosiae]
MRCPRLFNEHQPAISTLKDFDCRLSRKKAGRFFICRHEVIESVLAQDHEAALALDQGIPSSFRETTLRNTVSLAFLAISNVSSQMV